MTKKQVLKTVVLIILPIFAIGMLFISVSVDQAQAHSLTSENHRTMEHLSNTNYVYTNRVQVSPELKQEKIDLMKKHHTGDRQNRYQEMYGNDSGTHGPTRCRSPTSS